MFWIKVPVSAYYSELSHLCDIYRLSLMLSVSSIPTWWFLARNRDRQRPTWVICRNPRYRQVDDGWPKNLCNFPGTSYWMLILPTMFWKRNILECYQGIVPIGHLESINDLDTNRKSSKVCLMSVSVSCILQVICRLAMLQWLATTIIV